jgi:uncharacterized protein (DUF427 family)
MRPIEPDAGQESVWDYPRPPRVEPCDRLIQVRFGGALIAETRRGQRVLETSHPPVYYLPPSDVELQHLRPIERRTACEFKGLARYFDVRVGDRTAAAAAWSYPAPRPEFEAIRDHLAFYPSAMDACYLAGELVQAQEGDFYGGWITRDLVGPFKGGSGTWGW